MVGEIPSNMIFITFIAFINDLDHQNMIHGGKSFGCHGNHSCGTIFTSILEHRYLNATFIYFVQLFFKLKLYGISRECHRIF